MKCIVHELALFVVIALLGCTAIKAEVLSDPLTGAEWNWLDLEKVDGEIYGMDLSVEYRKLAEAQVETVRIVLVVGRMPIYKYENGKEVVTGYEFNSGMLLKKVGRGYSPLGYSSGFLSTDYPELSRAAIDLIYMDYINRLVEKLGGEKEAHKKLLASTRCQELDRRLAVIMQSKKILSCETNQVEQNPKRLP